MKIIKYIFFLMPFLSMTAYCQEQIIDNGYEKGKIVHGYKADVWEYYDDSTLIMKINYDTGKLLYLAKDTTEYAIKTDDGWIMSKLDIYPHYIGSMDEFNTIIYKNLKYPIEALQKNIRGTVLIGFEINKKGMMDSIKILKDIGEKTGKVVIKALKSVPDLWLVAKKDKKQYRSRFILPVVFKIGSMSSKGIKIKKNTKKEKKNLKEALENNKSARFLDEIVITALAKKKERRIGTKIIKISDDKLPKKYKYK